jgi:hypothetical protein
MLMHLVVMHNFVSRQNLPCVVANSEEKAQEWIDKTMMNKVYNEGVFLIVDVKVYQ